MLRFLIRLVLLPFRLVAACVAVAFRAGRLVGGLPVRVSGRLGRLLGFRAIVALFAGLAIGLLFAPGPGRQLRDRLRALAAARRTTTDADLATRVAFELEHAPRTWHLSQPGVSIADGRVVLSGRVDEPASRDELGRVAAAVPGVAGVDNLIEVAEAAAADPAGSGPA